jgi:hypothetical protein
MQQQNTACLGWWPLALTSSWEFNEHYSAL